MGTGRIVLHNARRNSQIVCVYLFKGVGDAARGDTLGSKSAASSVSSPERPEATRVPYPGGQDDVAIEPWSTARTRSSHPLRSGTKGYARSSAPQKHLLTPVQDVVGSLFQRSVQVRTAVNFLCCAVEVSAEVASALAAIAVASAVVVQLLLSERF